MPRGNDFRTVKYLVPMTKSECVFETSKLLKGIYSNLKRMLRPFVCFR
jgi:hypothetical protein